MTGNESLICQICYLRHRKVYLIQIYLTNRFQVAVRLFSNRSQMMSKYGKNKKVAHKAQPSDLLAILDKDREGGNGVIGPLPLIQDTGNQDITE